MIRGLYIIGLAGILGLANCDGGLGKANAEREGQDSTMVVDSASVRAAGERHGVEDFGDVDIAYEKDFGLYLYSSSEAIGKSGYGGIAIEAERDTVFNCVFSQREAAVYYTVRRNQHLQLKRLLLQDGQPAAVEEIEGWGEGPLANECMESFNAVRARLIYDSARDAVVLPFFYSADEGEEEAEEMCYEYRFRKCMEYTPGDGRVAIRDIPEGVYRLYPKEVEGAAIPPESVAHGDFCMNEENVLLYKGVDVSDHLELTPTGKDQRIEYCHGMVSPSGQKVAYGVILNGLPMSGALCISDADGGNQAMVSTDGFDPMNPPRWVGERLLYPEPSCSDGPLLYCLMLSDAEMNIPIKQVDTQIAYFCVR